MQTALKRGAPRLQTRTAMHASASRVLSRRDMIALPALTPSVPPLTQKSAYERYKRDASKLVSELSESIETNADASQSATKRKRDASDAKEQIQSFLKEYRNPQNVQIRESQSYLDIMRALRLLGQFYMRNGANAVLSDDTLRDIRGLLQSASDQLNANS